MNDTLALPKLASAQDLYDQAAEIEEKLDRIAKENLQLNPAYTWPEKAAIIAMEKLRLSQDLIIVPTIVQMNVADQVERLWTAKPGAYAGLKEAVETETTMSYSEFHNLLDLKRKILPYLDEQGVDALEFFQNYRKSNIREIIPYLKSVITGKASEKESVNAVLSWLREKVEDLPGVNSEDDIKGAIVNDILANAVGTNRMLRKSLRPDDTPDVVAVEYVDPNTKRVYWLLEMSVDQRTMMDRLAGRHIDYITVDLQYEEARRIPAVRHLLGEPGMTVAWEQSLIGTLLVEPNTWGEFADVAPADLATQQHRLLYAMAANLAKTNGLSIRTLVHTLEQIGELPNIGDETHRGVDYIDKLISLGDPATAGEQRKQVLNQSDLRKLQEVGGLLAAQARVGNKTAQEILQDHIQAILKVQRNTREPRLIGSLSPAYTERAIKITSGEMVPFWEPPILALRNVLPHLEEVDFMLIAGTPGTGKSSIVRALGLMTALENQAVLAMPFENSEEEYHSWALAQLARVNHYHVVDPRRQSPTETDKIHTAIGQLESMPYYIYGMGIATITELVSSIKTFVVKHPEVRLIIVDGIYLVGGKDNAYENISTNTQTLRSLAQDLHIPIVGTTQFKRLQRGANGKKAELDSLLYAGEQASRIVVAIEKKEMSVPELMKFEENLDERGRPMLTENLKTIVVQANVLKNTNGRTGHSQEMAWRKPYNVFDLLELNWRSGMVSLNDLSDEMLEDDDPDDEPDPVQAIDRPFGGSIPKPEKRGKKSGAYRQTGFIN